MKIHLCATNASKSTPFCKRSWINKRWTTISREMRAYLPCKIQWIQNFSQWMTFRTAKSFRWLRPSSTEWISNKRKWGLSRGNRSLRNWVGADTLFLLIRSKTGHHLALFWIRLLTVINLFRKVKFMKNLKMIAA